MGSEQLRTGGDDRGTGDLGSPTGAPRSDIVELVTRAHHLGFSRGRMEIAVEVTQEESALIDQLIARG